MNATETIVSRDGTVRVKDQHSTLIGSVVNTIPGWMAIDPTGKSHQYMYWRTRGEAVDYLVKKYEESIQVLPAIDSVPATDTSGTRVGYYTYLGAYRTGVLNGKRTTYVDGDAVQVSADTVDTWTRPVLWIREDELTYI